MPGKRKFEEQLASLDALRDLPKEGRIEPLRKALGSRNNFIAAKGADLIREFRLEQLTPDLLNAFDRFFENPEKTDPQCCAKNAISRTLVAFEHQDAETFLRGMRHIQMEPVWGGRSDTAGTLRATCALALVQCRSLTDTNLLAHLIDLLADKDKAVREESSAPSSRWVRHRWRSSCVQEPCSELTSQKFLAHATPAFCGSKEYVQFPKSAVFSPQPTMPPRKRRWLLREHIRRKASTR